MKSESVTRVGSNQRVCWERLKGESRTAERCVNPKPSCPFQTRLSLAPNTPPQHSQHARAQHTLVATNTFNIPSHPVPLICPPRPQHHQPRRWTQLLPPACCKQSKPLETWLHAAHTALGQARTSQRLTRLLCDFRRLCSIFASGSDEGCVVIARSTM